MYAISQNGIDLVKKFEGLRLASYQDSVGVWTIGYGSTSGVHAGMKITEGEAEERLRTDLLDAEECVNRKVGVVLTQSQFDALVSFVFNLGCQAFSTSTLLRLLNAGEPEQAAHEFLKWCHAGGMVLPGLQARRQAEQTLFLS